MRLPRYNARTSAATGRLSVAAAAAPYFAGAAALGEVSGAVADYTRARDLAQAGGELAEGLAGVQVGIADFALSAFDPVEGDDRPPVETVLERFDAQATEILSAAQPKNARARRDFDAKARLMLANARVNLMAEQRQREVAVRVEQFDNAAQVVQTTGDLEGEIAVYRMGHAAGVYSSEDMRARIDFARHRDAVAGVETGLRSGSESDVMAMIDALEARTVPHLTDADYNRLTRAGYAELKYRDQAEGAALAARQTDLMATITQRAYNDDITVAELNTLAPYLDPTDVPKAYATVTAQAGENVEEAYGVVLTRRMDELLRGSYGDEWEAQAEVTRDLIYEGMRLGAVGRDAANTYLDRIRQAGEAQTDPIFRAVMDEANVRLTGYRAGDERLWQEELTAKQQRAEEAAARFRLDMLEASAREGPSFDARAWSAANLAEYQAFALTRRSDLMAGQGATFTLTTRGTKKIGGGSNQIRFDIERFGGIANFDAEAAREHYTRLHNDEMISDYEHKSIDRFISDLSEASAE